LSILQCFKFYLGSVVDWIIVGIAGFLGGMLNAVAGGGSFITLPALIYVGLPPIAANATGTAALLPGYIASAWRFRKEIEIPANLSFAAIMVIALIGGSLGAGVLLMSSQSLFTKLIPYLILFATLAFIFGPQLVNARSLEVPNSLANRRSQRHQGITISVILFIICVYGGYFNGGLGIILLSALGLMGQTKLLGMNGLKNALSAILTAVAVVVYSVGGAISIKYLFVLGIAAIIGGYVGASLAFRVPPKILRNFVVIVGLVMSVSFFYKNA
jgi:uncharacterized membrane protein YfcA